MNSPAGGGGDHAEFWPLVNPRAHALGGKRPVLNEQVTDIHKQRVGNKHN